MLIASRQNRGRCRPLPTFDRLDDRTLLTASTAAHLLAITAPTVVAHHEAVASASHHVTNLHNQTSQGKVHAAVVKSSVHAAVVHHTTRSALKSVTKTSTATPALSRAVLHALATHKVHANFVIPGGVEVNSTTPIAGALTPQQVRTAYGITALPNGGAGTTIGIVDVFNDPAAAADLATFSTTYGLPQLDGLNGHGTFVSQSESGTVNSATSGTNDTSLETALDIEWAHAIAPLANIILYQVASFNYGDLLGGVQYLTGTPGVTAVSVSYGGGEFAGESTLESYFTTPTATNPNAAAIAFSTGDAGAPLYPATSPSVLAVGGTGLYIASSRGRYGFETAWGNVSGAGAGGGGVSTQFALPSFQASGGLTYARRSVPDVSAVADVFTAVSVINSWDSPTSPWTSVGGTSLACPVVSAMVDLAQEDRLKAGLSTLSSPQINAKLYAAYNSANYSTYFHDITVGNNHDVGTATAYYSATTGYDLATGIGSPIGNSFVGLLSSP